MWGSLMAKNTIKKSLTSSEGAIHLRLARFRDGLTVSSQSININLQQCLYRGSPKLE